MHLLMQVESDVFFAISDETRRALLLRLASEGEKNVTELLQPFSMSQPALSKHLKCLRKAGLVHRRKIGRMMFYEINAHNLQRVHNWVSQFERYWDKKLDALGSYLAKQKRNENIT
jgi:DNA-binding transcriptional ArsR family regulator